MKKKGYNKEKFVIHSNWNKKILVKNPQNGGIPAMENKATSKIFVNVLVEPKSLKECVVFKLIAMIWKIHVKTIRIEIL